MSEINICPICVEKMSDMGSQYICKSCGYKIAKMSAAISSINISNETATKKTSKTKTSTSAKKVISVLTALLSLAGVGLYVATTLIDTNHPSTDSTTNIDTTSEISEIYPPGSFFQSLAEYIFNCDYTDVTSEDYAKVTALYIYDDEDRLEITVDGETKTLSYKHISNREFSDLNFFTGLETLVAEDAELPDISNLKNLKVLYSSNTLEEMAKIVANPENMVELGLCSDSSLKTLDALAYFPNLENLYIDSSSLVDINGLNYLKKLSVLTLNDTNELTDFSALGSIENLQSLSINSKKLTDIDFLGKADKLKTLHISNSNIKDISPLNASKDSLTSLFLEENYYVADYSVISEMTNLTDLMLYRDFDSTLPDFSKLKNLKSLYISKIEKLEPVTCLHKLTSLTIKDGLLHNYEGIGDLSALTYLRLDGTNAYISNLHDLMKATSLQTLDISGTDVFGHIEEVLSLPNLSYFAMDECTLCFDFSKLKTNTELLYFSMNDVTLVEYDFDEYGYADSSTRREINVSDNIDGLSAFPYLSVLRTAGNNLSNINFAADLSNLRVLDIEDNYITDLTPLSKLQHLETVNCGGNTIVKGMDKLGDIDIID